MATVKAIKYGMKGDDVKNLQTTLNNLGYNLDVDGSFGPQTLSAVKQYQQKNGLTVDGMVGPQTQQYLFGGNTSKPAGSTNMVQNAGDTVTKTNLPQSAGDTVEKTKLNETSGTSATTGPIADPGASATEGSTKTESTQATNIVAPEYEAYTYDNYAKSDTVLAAESALAAIQAAQPGAYESKWQGQINEMIDRILNREKFTYDVNSDALYQQYAEQYQRLGKLAMQDTMGQAAAMTGGYGSSYAQSVGQQAYQGYLAQLNEMVPELYGMALDQYNREGQEMYNQYGLLSDQEQQDYGRYRDSYADWLAERDYATGRYDTEYDRDYGQYWDKVNMGYQVHSDTENRKWQEYVTALSHDEWQQGFDETVKQNAIGNEQWEKSFGETVKQNEIGNQQWEKGFEADEEQRKIGNQQWETSRQDGLNSETKSYAREDVMTVLSAGGDVTDEELAAAGMSRKVADAVKVISSATNSSSSVAEEAALKHVGTMSSKDIIDTLEFYAADGNNTAIEALLDDAFMTERIDEATYLDWKKKYLRTNSHTTTDTTVETPPRGSTGSGRGFSGLAGVNNVIK